MVKRNFKQIDLLRKRRGSNDLAEPHFIDTNKYIKKGIYSGGSMLMEHKDWLKYSAELNRKIKK